MASSTEIKVQTKDRPFTIKQSQKLIMELIKISLDCVVFLRHIFNDEHFVDQKFVVDVNASDNKRNWIKTKQVRRGISNDGDLYLNWIEKGIFESISLKYLNALQFGIYLDSKKPQSLIEAYVFEIDYDNYNLMFISDKHSSNSKTSNFGARERVQKLLRQIIVSIQALEPLPAEKYISIRLMFNENCPKDYSPPFFNDPNSLPPTISVEKGYLESKNKSMYSMNTGIDSVSVDFLTGVALGLDETENIDPFLTVFHSLNSHKTITSEEIEFPKYINCNPLPLSQFLNSCSKDSRKELPSTIPVETQDLVSPEDCECGADYEKSVPHFKCGKCNRTVHSFCYGVVSHSVAGGTCYTCMFGNLEEDLISLMRTRYLWKYFTNYGIPQFSQLLGIFKLLRKENNIVKILNLLFKDNVLATFENPILRKDGGFLVGCGVWIPSIGGIVDNTGVELKKKKKYYIAFVPRVKTYIKNLSYNQKTKEIYFANALATADVVISKLEQFKEQRKSSLALSELERSLEIFSSFNLPENIEDLSKKRMMLANKSPASDEIDQLSFEDSLTFLSQSQNLDLFSPISNKKRFYSVEGKLSQAKSKRLKIHGNSM
ncbi:uncharacterized protein PRCAT00005565001 [Priceomyces carsonii]|uniref:uncharacterized protein n=1 Tax=Priceomyces carsonii TaxID=28549 RepID=UPI002ED87154|nr:unnamed protein product [Priceomyces carsonii]